MLSFPNHIGLIHVHALEPILFRMLAFFNQKDDAQAAAEEAAAEAAAAEAVATEAASAAEVAAMQAAVAEATAARGSAPAAWSAQLLPALLDCVAPLAHEARTMRHQNPTARHGTPPGSVGPLLSPLAHEAQTMRHQNPLEPSLSPWDPTRVRGAPSFAP